MAAVMSIVLEKAFDSLSWEFLNQFMAQMGLDPGFIQSTEHLYSGPTAKVSELYKLGRGTKQGCPLSPLLFVIAVEPEARTTPLCDIIC